MCSVSRAQRGPTGRTGDRPRTVDPWLGLRARAAAPYEGTMKTYRWTIVTAALGALILVGVLALLLR